MTKYCFIGLFFLLLGSALSATDAPFGNKERIIDSLYDQIKSEHDLSDFSPEQERLMKNALSVEFEKSLALAHAGKLSLDPEAPNYFLLDTIKSVISGALDVAKKVGEKVISFAKEVVRPIAKIGLEFLGLADSKFIKTVVGTVADICAGLVSKFAPLVGAVVSYIPVVGPTISLVIDFVAPWVDSVVNYDTVGAVAGGIGKIAKAFNFTDDVIAQTANDAKKADIAPRADLAFASLNDAPGEQATQAQKEKAGKQLSKMCNNLMNFLRKRTPDEYNSMSTGVKRAAMQCNHWAKLVSSHGN